MNDEIDTTVPDDPAGNQLADNKSHAVANLKVVAGELDDEFHGMVFQDSDVYKWLEEAAYALGLPSGSRTQGAVRSHGQSHRPRSAAGRLLGHSVSGQVRRMGRPPALQPDSAEPRDVCDGPLHRGRRTPTIR